MRGRPFRGSISISALIVSASLLSSLTPIEGTSAQDPNATLPPLKKTAPAKKTSLPRQKEIGKLDRAANGWRFPTNRMKGTYLKEGSGKNELSYVSYDLGEGFSAGHIDWFHDDRVMVVFPRALDENVAEYAQQHPEETNPRFRGDEGKRNYDNILACILLYKVYKTPEVDSVGRKPPFYWYTSYTNGYEEHLFAIGNGVIVYVGLAFDRKSAMVWIPRIRSKP